jgi:hypothetical protein
VRGIAAQAWYLRDIVISNITKDIEYLQERVLRFEEAGLDSQSWITKLEGREEDLNRVRGYIQELGTPFEASGMKTTPFEKKQRELGRQILAYNGRKYHFYLGEF